MSSASNKHKDFLVEIGTEELPPKALRNLRNAFEQSICAELTKLNIAFGESAGELAAPRRLAVLMTQVANRQPDQDVELLGPAVKAAFDGEGNPNGAAQGFARKAGVDVAELQQVDTPKGTRLAHISKVEGKPTAELLPEVVTKALAELPIPKRMRWGASRAEFVRPLHWILMLHGEEVVDAEIMGLKTGNQTRGHRFHANTSIQINSAAEYVEILQNEAKVQVDYSARMENIRTSVIELAEKQLGGHAVIDHSLLEEVCSLVEWPVPLAGKFEERFLSVPAEALISSMKAHQKYFHVVDDNDQLMPNFITVSNIESTKPERVVDGNERVIRPRLADAAFFYETDKKANFAEFRERLKPVVFQAKLGSIFDKTERVAKLAETLAPIVKATAEDAKRAGELCKCDLVSDMVLEFDELQGIMGRYYAEASGENAQVSAAMYEQYLPGFAGDILPATATGSAVALADRLDTLTGIFGIGQMPSGSKDPFALRRDSLGVLRILVEGKFQASLKELIGSALALHTGISEPIAETQEKLLNYLLDRFDAWFSDLNIATECFQSVRALGIDNPADIYARVLAVSEFSSTDNSVSLAAANKRVANILNKAELDSTSQFKESLLSLDAEKNLFAAIKTAKQAVEPLVTAADYSAALNELSALRETVDTFFDDVMVMDENEQVRLNRLSLLQELRNLFLSVADISLLPSGD